MAELSISKRAAESPGPAPAAKRPLHLRETPPIDPMPMNRTVSADTDGNPRSPRPQLPVRVRDHGGLSTQQLLATLEVSDEGLVVERIDNFGDEVDPAGEILKMMRLVARGHGILEDSLYSTFEKWRHSDDDAQICSNRECFSATATRRKHGHTPPRKAILDIQTLAQECEENLHPESSWRALVYAPLLQQLLEFPATSVLRGRVSSMPCSSAQIIPEYLHPDFPSWKIDFCLFLQPEEDHSHWEEAPNAVERLRAELPGSFINFTDYYPLRRRPIGLHIVSKKPTETWDSAALRIGVWHAAHWNLLERMGDLRPSDEDRPKPPFLAGILIDQHDWYLVLSRREERKTYLWSKVWFGTTKTLMGTYQIVLGVQILRNWVQDDYWPTLKQLMGVHGETSLDDSDSSD